MAGWVAPAATMIAAMMTAANLGTRFTGWGFVVFTVGSIAWSIVAMSTGQQNLLLTNGFLTLVNVVGVWRWLGRQARYEDGGAKAAERSRRSPRVPTLFSAGAVVGAPVEGSEGKRLGTIVDAMLRCDGTDIAYVVVSDGGLAGVREKLRALPREQLSFTADGVQARIDQASFENLPAIEPDDWPAEAPQPT